MLEVLAPAGDAACLQAALNAGADAIYFGLDAGFNARARAANLAPADLRDTLQRLHDCGRRGYLTLNTLVFDHEFETLERLLEVAAGAGVDAVIVQDIGVACLIRAAYPSLRIHALTQMTCTDLGSLQFAESLGAARVTLARELSLSEIEVLAQSTALELEVFVHGALCIAYSGQCLTSEALGGRSANRGACAQACRLPYDLIVDGSVRELGDAAYLLSPQDLDASALVPQLVASGARAIKIEGRLKSPEYVAATTRLYRLAVDAAYGKAAAPTRVDQELAAQMFSRGASHGFLNGVDHQRLVDATHCDHVGLDVGVVCAIADLDQRRWLRLRTHRPLARGDGILVQCGREPCDELGGRVWLIRENGRDVDQCSAAEDLWVWLGPDRTVSDRVLQCRVHRTSSVALDQQAQRLATSSGSRVSIRAHLSGAFGAAPQLTLSASDGRVANVTLDCNLQPARGDLDPEVIRAKLSRLGDTPYTLTEFSVALPAGALLPLSSLNRARREAVRLLALAAVRSHQQKSDFALDSLLTWPKRAPPAGGLFVTCRSLDQAEAALAAGADGVYLDFLALTGLGPAFRQLRGRNAASIGIALPRIRKLHEDKIDQYLRRLRPDALLMRSLGSLASFGRERGDTHASDTPQQPLLIADFSVNITNTPSALRLLDRAVNAFTPSFDLDASQLCTLLDSQLAPFAEVVMHHPMPLFHMEHCIIAARLSSGRDDRDCGRPCDTHQISLRDRKGVELPVEADVGCRNTVLHGTSQSAARHAARLRSAGVTRFRIELLRESAAATQCIIETYRELLANRCGAADVRKRLSAAGLPVVEGSLRVLG